MEIKVQNKESEEILEEQTKPLLEDQPVLEEQQQPSPQKTPAQKAIRKTFKRTSYLSGLLPTGSILIFEMFSPVVTNNGECHLLRTQLTTTLFLIFIAATCLIMSFTDSVRDERGKVRYGIATSKGLWIVDGTMTLQPEDQFKYRIRFLDFLHAIMGISVFMAVALLDHNINNCFFPKPSEETRQLLSMLPIGIGGVCSLLYVCFPNKRNGVAAPLSKN